MEYSKTDTSKDKILNFTDLRVWQAGHALVISVYKITKAFPREELFGLVSQLRRASVSVTSNIAEGFGRQSYKEKIQFYHLAYGSLVEVQNQLLVSRDVGYISREECSTLLAKAVETGKLLRALITKSRTFC